MKEQKIKVGFCVAYDWYFLEHSLPLVYEDADEICLSIDKERISWAGQPFTIAEEGLKKLLQNIDKDKKIKIFEEDFHLPELTPMQNEVRQRNLMAEFMGLGGWHIQLDADEYFINFNKFVSALRLYKGKTRVNICVPFIILFKQLESGWLMVSLEDKSFIEYVPIASRKPKYQYGRRNDYFNYKMNYPILHQSWARSYNEIEEKVKNWGHKNDFNVKEFILFWENLNGENFLDVKNFHPMVPHLWPSFNYLPLANIDDVVNFFDKNEPDLQAKEYLQKENSLLRSRIKAFLKKTKLSR